MNWSLALLRSWLVLSGAWVALNVAPVWNGCLVAISPGPCAVGLVLAFGAPVVVLLSGLGLLWMVGGRHDDSRW